MEKIKIGETYTSIGTCGMTKDIRVIGTLSDYDEQNGTDTIFCDTREQPCEVNARLLKEVIL
jgi:hypothetical protein